MHRLTYTLLAGLVGGLYGWVGDGGHVLASVLQYPRKDHLWWPGLAWWVLPQFAAGGVILSLLVRAAMARKLRAEPGYTLGEFPSYGLGAVCFLASLLVYLLSSLLSLSAVPQRHISLTLAALTLVIGAVLVYATGSRSSVSRTMALLALPVGLGGVGWESSLCHIGVFNYVKPDPGLWVNHWIAFLWIGAVWSAIFPMWRYEFNVQKQQQAGKKQR